jgi:short-subunit dehydrogenase
MNKRVALVTGASSGIGETTARYLLDAGFIVYGAARRVDRMTDLATTGVRTLALDVTEEASSRNAVQQILGEEGRIDVLVNGAGYGSYGALEEVPMHEARAQIDVNLFGLAHLTQLVLPAMRAQRSGTVINIASMGGQFATPLGAWYHASKFAVEGLSDALRLELRQFGIDVVIVEPGSIRTEWGAIAAEKLRATSGHGPYSEQAGAMATSLANSSSPDARMTSPTSVIAKAVTKLVVLSRVLPTRVFDSFVKRASGVPA